MQPRFLRSPSRPWPPANAVFGCARVAAVLFALVAASTIVLGVSQALRTGLALRYIKWYSRRHPETAHAVVFGAGPQARQVVDDIQKRSTRKRSTRRAAVQRAAARNGAASGPDAASSNMRRAACPTRWSSLPLKTRQSSSRVGWRRPGGCRRRTRPEHPRPGWAEHGQRGVPSRRG